MFCTACRFNINDGAATGNIAVNIAAFKGMDAHTHRQTFLNIHEDCAGKILSYLRSEPRSSINEAYANIVSELYQLSRSD